MLFRWWVHSTLKWLFQVLLEIGLKALAGYKRLKRQTWQLQEGLKAIFSRIKGQTNTVCAPTLSLSRCIDETFKICFEIQNEFSNFNDWKRHSIQSNINSCYWFQVIELESLFFSFINSLRDADFLLFVKFLKDTISRMSLLDYVHYARWLSVFVKDL